MRTSVSSSRSSAEVAADVTAGVGTGLAGTSVFLDTDGDDRHAGEGRARESLGRV
jgi:hypothetical protein